MESSSVGIEVTKQPPPLARPNSATRARAQDKLPRFNSKRTLSQELDNEKPSPASYSPGEHSTTPLTPRDLSSAEMLMARGVQAMNQSLAEAVENALGAPIPSVEVRFKDVRLVACISVASAESKANELPTLWNQVVKGVNGLFAKQNIVEKEILRGITGSFKPGRITLVLGQPGSGKSALMKILSSGRLPAARRRSAAEKEQRRQSIFPADGRQRSRTSPPASTYKYSEQIHWLLAPSAKQHGFSRLWSLQPRLLAPLAGRRYGKQGQMTGWVSSAGNGLESWMIEALKNCTVEQHEQALQVLTAHLKYAPELVVKKLGLDVCKDTVVGDDMLRGISGGERKRVTTDEMSFGLIKVHLMDEISTGLDSAAAYDIVNSFKSMAVNFKSIIVISLLQAAPEVFELFDDLIVLNDGHIMFQGECSQALPNFESIGFRCPPRRDDADFLLDLGSNKQHVYVIPGFPGDIPYHAEDFANRFRQSEIFQTTLASMDAPVKHLLGGGVDFKPFRENFIA